MEKRAIIAVKIILKFTQIGLQCSPFFMLKELHMADTYVRARIDEQLKIQATAIFEQMGLSMSDFIRIALTRAVMERGIPFEMKIPNETTRSAIDDVISRRISSNYISTAKDISEFENEINKL